MAALVAYSKMLAEEFRSTWLPPVIATSGAEGRFAQIRERSGGSREEAEAELLATIGGVPLGRRGTVPEVAELIAFLVWDAASYLTVTEIAVDGGNLRTL